MIETTTDLSAHLTRSSNGNPAPVCALDTEADSLHRYRESLCLIQYADRDSCVLMDPLAIEDLSPLGDFLARSTVWMHGADYDMTMIKRQFGILPPMVFDTQIGARLLGERRFGLGDLVLRYFDVELSKSSQKADWGKRPLSPRMVDYALNDVRYLLEMGDIIVAALREKGRYEWFEESCVVARDKVRNRDESRDEETWRVRGSGNLDRRGLGCLRALWQWRDGEAKSWDRPSFMVATNKQLLEWSVGYSAGRKIEVPRHYRTERVKRFRKAMAEFEALADSEWPERVQIKRRKRDKDFESRVAAVLKQRDAIAGDLDIEPSLVAPRMTVEAIISSETTSADSLMGWQRSLMSGL
ncbi:MAG: HRDC domain-containing protein [Verrucomicrobiota bacterium]